MPRTMESRARLALFTVPLAVGIVAFWPSFFSQLAGIDAGHLIHGITATLWLIMPVFQAWLIRTGRLRRHRQCGWVTVGVLAPLLVVSGLYMVQRMVLRFQATHAPRLLKFTLLDLGALSLFVVFLALAVVRIRRKDLDGHVRYLGATVLLAFEPVLERVFVYFVPGISGFEEAAYDSLITLEIILAALLYFEWRRGRMRAPFAATLGFFVAMHVLMTPVTGTAAFAAFANWFAAL